MPVHDWTRVDPGLFHDFHQSWSVALKNALNAGPLPPNYFALVEQRTPGTIPDLLTSQLDSAAEDSTNGRVQDEGGVAVAAAPPRTRFVCRTEAEIYAGKANRIVVRHRHGKIVAVIEIVSPGNKAGEAAFRSLVTKIADLMHEGINVLVIDLFPPGPRDPLGIHKVIWDQFATEEFTSATDKPLIIASYDAGDEKVAYVEPVGIGGTLPDMPVFLRPGHYATAPLEASYQETWRLWPDPFKGLLMERRD